MPATPGATIHEVLVAPLPLLLSRTAAAVAEAQITLDEAAMQTQQRLDELTEQALLAADPEAAPSGLARFQLEAPWYHLPEVTVEMKLSLSLEVRQQDRPGGKRVFHPTLSAIPHNASTQNRTGFTAAGTSSIHARIAAVPPPARSV